ETGRTELARLIAAQPEATTFGDTGLDETLGAMRHEMRRFARGEVEPHAHAWHLSNSYIPAETLAKLGELGVFASPSPRPTAASASARKPCAWCRRSCRAAISAWARSAPARRSPPS